MKASYHVFRNHTYLKHPADVLSDWIQEGFSREDRPIQIAIGGPGGTGKSSLANALVARLPEAKVLTLDDYKTSRVFRQEHQIYGPHPDANEMELIVTHLRDLAESKPIQKPVYCRDEGAIRSSVVFEPVRYHIVEGEISTYDDFRPWIDFAVYIDADYKTQLKTRVERDIDQRGYSWEKAMLTFLHSNLREFGQYGEATKKSADVVLRCSENYQLELEAVSEALYLRYFSQ